MGHSIYLADDEKSIRELLHSFLASDGYTVPPLKAAMRCWRHFIRSLRSW